MVPRIGLLQGALAVKDVCMVVLDYFLQSDVLTWVEEGLSTRSMSHAYGETVLGSKEPMVLAWRKRIEKLKLSIWHPIGDVYVLQALHKTNCLCNRSYCFYVARGCICDDPT